MHLRWVSRLEEEFFMQGDKERSLGGWLGGEGRQLCHQVIGRALGDEALGDHATVTSPQAHGGKSGSCWCAMLQHLFASCLFHGVLPQACPSPPCLTGTSPASPSHKWASSVSLLQPQVAAYARPAFVYEPLKVQSCFMLLALPCSIQPPLIPPSSTRSSPAHTLTLSSPMQTLWSSPSSTTSAPCSRVRSPCSASSFPTTATGCSSNSYSSSSSPRRPQGARVRGRQMGARTALLMLTMLQVQQVPPNLGVP